MLALTVLSATAFVLQRPTPTSCVQHAAAATSSSLLMSHGDVRGTDRRTALGLAGAAAAGVHIHVHSMLPRRCPACRCRLYRACWRAIHARVFTHMYHTLCTSAPSHRRIAPPHRHAASPPRRRADAPTHHRTAAPPRHRAAAPPRHRAAAPPHCPAPRTRAHPRRHAVAPLTPAQASRRRRLRPKAVTRSS